MHTKRTSLGSLGLFLGVLLVMLCAACGGGGKESPPANNAASEPTPQIQLDAIKISATGVGSPLHTLAVGIGDIITKNTAISASVVSTGGADAAVRQLRDQRAEFSVTNNDPAIQALMGNLQFADEGKAPVRLIGQGQTTLRTIVVRADAGIKEVPDLKGNPFAGKRPSEVTIERFGNAVLNAYGINPGEVKFVETADVAQCTQAIQQGSVKAAIIPGGVPAASIMNLAQALDVILISIDDPDKQAAILNEMGPAFKWETIPAGTYKGQEDPVTTISESVVFITREDVPEEAVYQITKAIYDNYDTLKLVHNVAKEWTVENALKDPGIPFHPGAIKYFKETGAWDADMEQIQQDLLAKI